MSRRRFVVILAFLWLGALSGFFYKYRGDLGTVAKALTAARSERARLDHALRALGETQQQHATTLVELRTTVAANTEICGQHPPDLGGRLAASEGRLALAERYVSYLAARTATLQTQTTANTRTRTQLERRIFRK